jgi:hypothetical protein
MCDVFAQIYRMDHVISTLIGIAGALVPMALGFWIQQRHARLECPGNLSRVTAHSLVMDEAIVRGGRIYL